MYRKCKCLSNHRLKKLVHLTQRSNLHCINANNIKYGAFLVVIFCDCISLLVRQLSYSPPINAYTANAAPQGSVADESAMTEDSERLNLQPASNDVGTVHDVQADSFDSEPLLSPMNAENANGFANDSDVQSSAFEDAQEHEEDDKSEDFGDNDEDDQQEPVSAQVTSATTAEPAETGQVFDDASSISSSSSEADDEAPQDDPEDSGIMV